MSLKPSEIIAQSDVGKMNNKIYKLDTITESTNNCELDLPDSGTIRTLITNLPVEENVKDSLTLSGPKSSEYDKFVIFCHIEF
jgi:hypothetical protein